MEYYGIDFGTTNSATIGLSYEHVERYGDEHGQPFPSIIAIDKMTGQVKSKGRDAWLKREELRESCEIITSVKTVLGTDKTWNIGNKTWRPQEVATEILKGLKEQVARLGGGTHMESAIVSIPIGFSPRKRRELRSAAWEAGIKVISFVSEPSSAVYKYYKDVARWQKVAVFDWGGGTLDIAVVELNEGVISELSTFGVRLGGDDLDYKIAEWAHRKILQHSDKTITFKEMASKHRDMMLVQAEQAKRELSQTPDTSIILFEYGEFDPPEIKLDRNTFISLIEPEINQAISYLKETIKNAGISIDELGCILMVGGSSKLQGLLENMYNTFDCDIIEPDADSDWHIAHGAALLNKRRGNYLISQNVGLLLSDNTYFPLLKKGDTVSHDNKSVNFGLVEDSRNAHFIFQESHVDSPVPLESHRRNIGYLTVPTFGFVYEPIEMTFQVDNNLLLKVSVYSTGLGEGERREWEFDQLRFSYQLPVE